MKKKKRKTPYELLGKPIEMQIEMSKLNVIPNAFRRSFKAGDIVALKDSKSVPFILKTNEYKAVETSDEIFKADDLVLICPVENRVDVGRKEGAK